jgi:hypothetical protein
MAVACASYMPIMLHWFHGVVSGIAAWTAGQDAGKGEKRHFCARRLLCAERFIAPDHQCQAAEACDYFAAVCLGASQQRESQAQEDVDMVHCIKS